MDTVLRAMIQDASSLSKIDSAFILTSEVGLSVSSNVRIKVLPKKRVLLEGVIEMSTWAEWQGAVQV